MDCLLPVLEDRPGLIGSMSGRSSAPPQMPVFGTSPLKVRMEQIHEGSDVTGRGLVEGALQIVFFDHPARLHQTVLPAIRGLGVGSGVDGAMVTEDPGLKPNMCKAMMRLFSGTYWTPYLMSFWPPSEPGSVAFCATVLRFASRSAHC
jgi:hypothetical protein